MKRGIFWGAAAAFFLFLVAGYGYALWQTAPPAAEKSQPAESVVRQKQEICADTELIYRYFYTRDGVTKEQREPAPDFLQGLNRKQLESIYSGWQIAAFSPEQVILRCSIDGKSSENYLIVAHEGYIAIFYEDEQKSIRLLERTEIPLAALPEGEQVQLQDGLRVTGEENLARLLADYLS